MALILFLLIFSGLCWVVVLWSWKTRSRQAAEERTATDCRRTEPDRLQESRWRGHKRNHLRSVSKSR